MTTHRYRVTRTLTLDVTLSDDDLTDAKVLRVPRSGIAADIAADTPEHLWDRDRDTVEPA